VDLVRRRPGALASPPLRKDRVALHHSQARGGTLQRGRFQAFLGLLLMIALLANGVVRRRLRTVPRS
jgi:hypothetical protein